MREVAAVVIFLVFSVFTYAAPVHLRCESVQNPLGIDALTPRLSWQSDNKENNWKQSAYQILLASSAEQLSAGHGNVWDSGKVSSGESIGIAYGGPKLESRKRYYWSVRVWDEAGKALQSSESAWFETGLLNKEDWTARWITWTNPEEAADRAGIRWIWVAGQDALKMAPKVSAEFRTEVDVAEKPRGEKH
jgi:alpha-L-rhamnosidase